MCDHLITAALRQWERTGLGPKDGRLRLPLTPLTEWFEHHICPIAPRLLDRADFRQLARWPIESLGPGSRTEARRLIESIDKGLTRCAGALARVAERYLDKHEDLPVLLDFIASRPWRDLVSPADYWEPKARLNLSREIQLDSRLHEGKRVWDGPNPGDLHPFFCPDLSLPGDFVSRCAIRRIEVWLSRLGQFQSFINKHIAHHQQGCLREAVGILTTIESELSRLRGALLDSREAHVRSACIALVQVYRAFRLSHRRLSEALPWLAECGVASCFWGDFHRQIAVYGNVAVADAVVAGLVELREFARVPVDYDAVIDEARRTHMLCIVDGVGRREAYWRGELIDRKWEEKKRAWALLWGMAEAAITRRGIDVLSLNIKSPRDARRDLKAMLPPELFCLITSRNRAYCLRMQPDQIAFFRIASAIGDDRIENVADTCS